MPGLHDASDPAPSGSPGITVQKTGGLASSDKGKLRVFISYSRDDLDFADQLAAALDFSGFECLIDREGISGGEAWKKRLGNLISEADTVVFVLSPSSARSEICEWEVEEAARLSKRVLPVICQPVEGVSPPPRLRELNYIFFYKEPKVPGSGFGTGLGTLITALTTDFDWLREHTRYLQRAIEWDKGGRPANRLLAGNDILEAKGWAARRPKGAPEPTALHFDFIRASEEEAEARSSEQRKQLEAMAIAQTERAKALTEREEAQTREAVQARRVVRRTFVGLAVAVVLAVIALSMAGVLWGTQTRLIEANRAAQAERDRAKNALAEILAERSWSSLGSSNPDLAVRYAMAGWRGAPLNAAHYRAPLARALAAAIVPVTRKLHHGLVNSPVKFIVSSPDGSYIISGGDDGFAVLIDAASLQILREFPHKVPITTAAVDPSGQRVLTVTLDAEIHIWDIKTGERTILKGHQREISAASFSPDARRLVSASFDKTARLWDVVSGRMITVLEGHRNRVSAALFSPDGRRLVTASWDNTTILWDAETGEVLSHFKDQGAQTYAVAFSPDGKYVLTGGADQTVRVYDTSKQPSSPRKLEGHKASIRAISLSPEGSRAHVIDFEGNTYIWDMRTFRILVASTGGGSSESLASFGLDGRFAAISGTGNAIKVWDADAARVLLELENSKTASAILWSGSRLFVGDVTGMLSVYDLREVTQPMTELAGRACAKKHAPEPRFTWMESATDPLIREVWDPEGVVRSVCD